MTGYNIAEPMLHMARSVKRCGISLVSLPAVAKLQKKSFLRQAMVRRGINLRLTFCHNCLYYRHAAPITLLIFSQSPPPFPFPFFILSFFEREMEENRKNTILIYLKKF